MKIVTDSAYPRALLEIFLAGVSNEIVTEIRINEAFRRYAEEFRSSALFSAFPRTVRATVI